MSVLQTEKVIVRIYYARITASNSMIFQVICLPSCIIQYGNKTYLTGKAMTRYLSTLIIMVTHTMTFRKAGVT